MKSHNLMTCSDYYFFPCFPFITHHPPRFASSSTMIWLQNHITSQSRTDRSSHNSLCSQTEQTIANIYNHHLQQFIMCLPTSKKASNVPELATLSSSVSVGDASSSSSSILANNAYNNNTRPSKEDTQHIKAVTSTHSDHVRNTNYDMLWFLGPALICHLLGTPIYAIYAIGIARIVSTRLTITLHYLFFDKDNYLNKTREAQLK